MKKGIGLFLVLVLAFGLGMLGCSQQLQQENESLKAANDSLTTQVTQLQTKNEELTKQVADLTQERDACQNQLKAGAPGTQPGSTAAAPAAPEAPAAPAAPAPKPGKK
jgi:FtsZ-binding cell division protein ZapB